MRNIRYLCTKIKVKRQIMEKNYFEGKSVLVTGASSGLGEATAIMFAKAGAKVALAARRTGVLEQIAAPLRRENPNVITIACDTSDEQQVRRCVEQVVEAFGGLDIAFNSAGIQASHERLADMTTEDFDRVINVNLRGTYFCDKYEIRAMLAAKQKDSQPTERSIINCSSQGGLVGIPTISGYTASKHGVIGLTRSAALEYARDGIRINAVCPGTCDTPMVATAIEADPEGLKQVIDAIPLGRMGRAEEIAGTVLWLASPQAAFVIGQAIPVDGGYTTC